MGLKLQQNTKLVCPSSRRTQAPVLASHSRSVLSSDADASMWPRSVHATSQTPCVWQAVDTHNAYDLIGSTEVHRSRSMREIVRGGVQARHLLPVKLDLVTQTREVTQDYGVMGCHVMPGLAEQQAVYPASHSQLTIARFYQLANKDGMKPTLN